jgi:hypothetical protein
MNNQIVAAFITVAGTLLGVLIGSILGRISSNRAIEASNKNSIDIIKKQEFYKAASKFRSDILYVLLGFYPIDQHWEERNFILLYEYLPKIKSASAEFRFFVKNKEAFDSAVKDYDEYCRETKYQDVMNYSMYKKSMYSPEDKGPKERFKVLVEHLISFSNEIHYI